MWHQVVSTGLSPVPGSVNRSRLLRSYFSPRWLGLALSPFSFDHGIHVDFILTDKCFVVSVLSPFVNEVIRLL